MSLKDLPSSARRQVLGRGLDSLFSPASGHRSQNKKSPVVSSLGIEQIHPNPRQPRKIFDKQLLKELADSISRNGLIQPVIVRKNGSKYEIVAGERRWRAAAQAGLHQIPVRVLDQKEDHFLLPLVENLQRQDLNPIELAQAYKELMQKEKLTQEKLADLLSIPRATLANQLRILNLSSEVQNLILEGKLSLALAKILLQEKDISSQLKWAKYFSRNKTGVRQAQKLLSQSKKPKRMEYKSQHKKNWQTQAINKIQDSYGVKSYLRFRKTGGELCLRFFSEEELRSLMETLLQIKSLEETVDDK